MFSCGLFPRPEIKYSRIYRDMITYSSASRVKSRGSRFSKVLERFCSPSTYSEDPRTIPPLHAYTPPSRAEPWVCAYTPLAHLTLTLTLVLVCPTYVCITYTPPQGTAEPSLAGAYYTPGGYSSWHFAVLEESVTGDRRIYPVHFLGQGIGTFRGTAGLALCVGEGGINFLSDPTSDRNSETIVGIVSTRRI